ncbi:terpenoid cyclases/protein prenyltransferase alpha-alpha toroid [Aspergillus bertholletiae]|uniref:Terpenoid cyclases/protein prenyltransferase alpha-alpha toroid n=1 Tax=Aspergillus bertholletiae TaxID=1226010 RepID=A0A5N7B6W3_9EURO|nr:terpenoid cyclases/protein prenyltransferase alpha-alpha toroid [Aspergillus bertholletiae]
MFDSEDSASNTSPPGIQISTILLRQSWPWYGRWGSNYIYGTSTVLCGLVYHLEGRDDTYPVMEKRHNPDIHTALDWLKRTQNSDGRWGERLETYYNPGLAANGPSTALQTAWALMGLLAHLPPVDTSIIRGIRYLSPTQIKEGELSGSWKEDHYTGTGFPNHFYLCYILYSQYFPMMALGRYTSLSGYRSLKDLDSSVGNHTPKYALHG